MCSKKVKVLLQNEIWLNVFKYLKGTESRYVCATVCRKWSKIVLGNATILPEYRPCCAQTIVIINASQPPGLWHKFRIQTTKVVRQTQNIRRLNHRITQFLSNLTRTANTLIPVIAIHCCKPCLRQSLRLILAICHAFVSTFLSILFLEAWQPSWTDLRIPRLLLFGLSLTEIIAPLYVTQKPTDHDITDNILFTIYLFTYVPQRFMLLLLSAILRFGFNSTVPLLEECHVCFWATFVLIHCADILFLCIFIVMPFIYCARVLCCCFMGLCPGRFEEDFESSW
ncbi:hypothetical protein Ddc_11848 [Ditylenchus destructor]|nr:hypothetical protein Ddc_11848 [Ditylenchus destructor]